MPPQAGRDHWTGAFRARSSRHARRESIALEVIVLVQVVVALARWCG